MTAATLKAAFDGAETIDLWPEPRDLPGGLLPVEEFDTDLLPTAFQPWVNDIAERMQTPAEFVAVPAMIAAGSLIGRKIGIRPMQFDDWQETPNMWGCIVGRPGVMKSPAVKSALKPLARLEAMANEAYRIERQEWDESQVERDLRKDAQKAAIKRALKDAPGADVSHLRLDTEAEPTPRRYKANDSSYQALGELLRENTNGLLIHRDELMSLLRALEREDNSEARGFYLTGWNGSESYTFDRIGRGTNLHIPSLTISLLGSTQPALIQNYVRRVMGGRLNRRWASAALWYDCLAGYVRPLGRTRSRARRQIPADRFRCLPVSGRADTGIRAGNVRPVRQGRSISPVRRRSAGDVQGLATRAGNSSARR